MIAKHLKDRRQRFVPLRFPRISVYKIGYGLVFRLLHTKSSIKWTCGEVELWYLLATHFDPIRWYYAYWPVAGGNLQSHDCLGIIEVILEIMASIGWYSFTGKDKLYLNYWTYHRIIEFSYIIYLIAFHLLFIAAIRNDHFILFHPWSL